MGFPKHYLGKARPPKSWAATVGAMKEHGTRVKAGCDGCSWWLDPLPLDPIIDRLGEGYSLFDKRPRCRQPGCRGRVIFFFKPGGEGGSPYRPCMT